ncbi:MAG: hypothetical protein JWP01_3453 [Myxococcales bacterium]|nr:hypothetical protein [Myxococcales bacterium]
MKTRRERMLSYTRTHATERDATVARVPRCLASCPLVVRQKAAVSDVALSGSRRTATQLDLDVLAAVWARRRGLRESTRRPGRRAQLGHVATRGDSYWQRQCADPDESHEATDRLTKRGRRRHVPVTDGRDRDDAPPHRPRNARELCVGLRALGHGDRTRGEHRRDEDDDHADRELDALGLDDADKRRQTPPLGGLRAEGGTSGAGGARVGSRSTTPGSSRPRKKGAIDRRSISAIGDSSMRARPPMGP